MRNTQTKHAGQTRSRRRNNSGAGAGAGDRSVDQVTGRPLKPGEKDDRHVLVSVGLLRSFAGRPRGSLMFLTRQELMDNNLGENADYLNLGTQITHQPSSLQSQMPLL